jgi:GTPase SAR1 family protein
LLLQKYERATESCDTYVATTRDFAVRVPVVGAFSAGKSTLLNEWLGERIFATNLDPQTAIPAEIFWGADESITGCRADGRRKSITRGELLENQIEELGPDGWVQVKLPASQLAALAHLRVVDMPGWDSGIDGHKRAIDGYAQRSLAYVVVVSAEEGALRQSIRDALMEIAVRGLPVIVVITKSEKKSAEESMAVARNVAAEIERVMGKAPLRIATVSARKHEIGPFVAGLRELEAMAESLFVRTVVGPLTHEIGVLRDFLATLVNRDNLDGEKISLQLQQLERDIGIFDQRLERETGDLEKRAKVGVARIVERVNVSLLSQADSLAHQAMNGSDIGARVESAVRLAVTQGINEEFIPEIKDYCGKVAAAIPVSIRSTVRTPGGGDGLNIDYGAIASTLTLVAPLLTTIPVVGPIIAPAMKYLMPLLAVLGGKGTREVEHARRLDEITNMIRDELVPSAVQQTREAIEPALHAQIEEAKQRISEGVEAQRRALTDALELARRDSTRQKAEFEALFAQYRQDAASVDAMLARLGAASE